MKRRELLAATLGASALSMTGGQLWAAPRGEARFLLVFLRGGYDAASLLVPVASPFYYEARPQIAIARPAPGDAQSALALDAEWGLHPALRESLLPMWQRGEAAFVPFAGTPDLSRSHFETQDSIELGQPLEGRRDFQSGFLNRLAALLAGSDPMAFTDQLPLVFRGSASVPNTALRSVARAGVDARQSGLIASMYQGNALQANVQAGFATRDEVMRELAAEMDAAGRNAVSTRGFEQEARRVARLMRERYGIGFVDVGGWDTHVGQGAGTGYLATRFEELGRGLAGYAEEMGPAWRDTTVVVLSEFGRTFRQNGNRGTDHGHGTVYWLLGGAVRGGRVAGEQVRVERATLLQDRDWPVLNDYRALLGGVFARLWDLAPSQSERVFAGMAPRDLKLV